MLIKLTAARNPDIDGGAPAPVYVDASRVLCITRTSVQFTKVESLEPRRIAYDNLWKGVQMLNEHTGGYIPSMTDPVAVEWMSRARETAQRVTDAYAVWSRAYTFADNYPRQMCTEIQLACGTALEHGVMLSRLWVQESPEEVALAVARVTLGGQGSTP